MENKKILILGANPETVSLVLKARSMGLKTYVTDYNPDAFAKKYADVGVDIDASHIDEIVAYVRDNHIDGVLLGVAEALMPAYYHICEKLGYPCFATLEQFNIMASKDAFKDECRKYGVPVVPEYGSKEDVKDYPVVVKPVDSCSSKGISVCRNEEELEMAIAKALEFSRSKKYIIEKYMTGEEVVIYYVIQDGEPSLVGMCDRYTNKEQYGVAQLPTSYIYPSKYLNSYKEKVDDKVHKLLCGMGIKNGVLFLQAFVDNGEVKVYEPGFRLNGAQEHIIISALTGIDAKQLLISYAMNGKMSLNSVKEKAAPDLNGKWGCKLSPLIRTGRIKKIVGIDKIRDIDGIISINPSYNDGDTVEGLGTLKQIVCRFYIIADTKEELKKRIDKVYEMFDVIDDNGDSMMLKKFDTRKLENFGSEKICASNEEYSYTLDTVKHENGFSYYILIPHNNTTEKDEETYPVLYAFHGTGGPQEWIDERQGNMQKYLENYVNLNICKPFIMVMPWVTSAKTFELNMTTQQNVFDIFFGFKFKEFIDSINKKYGNFISNGAKNQGVVGFSMGASTALYNAIQCDGEFRYIGAISVAKYTDKHIPSESFKVTNNIEPYLNYFGYGELEDAEDFISQDKYCIECFIENNCPCEIEVNPGTGHDWNTFNSLLKSFFSKIFK